MSSANIMDVSYRKGQIVGNENVAYILIRKEELTGDLKEKLRLNGNIIFWNKIRQYSDDGNYYGIWVKITSSNMSCDEISELLAKQALALPDVLKNKQSTESLELDSHKKH